MSDVQWNYGPGDEVYEIAKARAKGEIPNLPGREGETARERAERWNAANPQDPIAVAEDV